MGSWKLEAARMAMYTMFPVALFHYFNQPKFFESWVKETKRRIMPPENPEDRASIRELVRQLRQKELEQFED